MDVSRPRFLDVHRFTWALRMSVAAVGASVAVLCSSSAVGAQATEDSLAVRALVEAYRNTWNGHNPAALAAFFTEDADMIMGTDPISLGRRGIEEWWQAYFARQEPQRQVVIEVHALRSLAPDVALVNVTTTTQGRSADGEGLRSRDARGTWVVVRDNGEWEIAAMRGMPTEQDQILRGSSRAGS
jgi:uncharacterized protein (TIGR02246 family)